MGCRAVYIAQTSIEYERMFKDRGWIIVNSIEQADLVQFTGGADVSPEIYGEKNTRSHCNMARDKVDMLMYASALRQDIPMAGICRGGQFLNVMNGGKMEQHISGHCTSHDIVYENEKDEMITVPVSSTHHQHMLPNDDLAFVIAKSSGDKAPEDVNEVIYYDYTNTLCFQAHPEMRGYEKCQDFYFMLLDTFLFTDKDDDIEEDHITDADMGGGVVTH